MSHQPESKILITGTGRCGTTFLIKLLSFLGMYTGFTRENYKRYIFTNCNSGLERQYHEPYPILKNPSFISEMNTILEKETIQLVIIPIRDLKASASSRVRHEHDCGGLWNAHDEESQILYYHRILSEYMCIMTKHDIPTLFLDFDRMISDKQYLFDKLKPILEGIDLDTFCQVYEEVSESSRPKI
jgi:hypothetical protein